MLLGMNLFPLLFCLSAPCFIEGINMISLFANSFLYLFISASLLTEKLVGKILVILQNTKKLKYKSLNINKLQIKLNAFLFMLAIYIQLATFPTK